MKCDEIMIHDVAWCVPTDAVATAAKAMKIENLDSVPVCKSRRNRHLVGIVTDHDLVCHVVADRRNADKTTVQEVMTWEPVTCHGNDDLGVALDAMHRNQILQIPVVNESSEPIGVITLADAILWTGEPHRIVETISSITHNRRAHPSRAGTVNADSRKPKVRHGEAHG